MQQGDYSYYQHPNPPLTNPNPVPNSNFSPSDPHYAQTPAYASAPPFSSNYDYSSIHTSYNPYNTNIDQPHPQPPPVPAPQSTFLQQPAPQPGFTQPPPSQPGFNQPPPSQPGFTQPPQSQQGFNQPPPSQPGFNQPPPSQPGFNQPLPSQPPLNFSPFDSHASGFAQPSTLPNYASPFEPNQIPSTHVPPQAYNPPSSINSPYSSMYPQNYDSTGPSSKPPAPYDTLFENPAKYDPGLGYFDGKYNRSNSDSNSSFSRKQESSRYDDLYGDGVYRYEGGKHDPYGSRGTSSKSSNLSGFDDFGRAINAPSSASAKPNPSKIVRAVPKIDSQQDSKGGVQKFRVKLLAESGGQSTMDVLCQIGLDGIRMLDPTSNRTQRIYPLENITRCDKLDSSTFAFWSKSAVDIEPKRIRLQSSGYAVNTLLDLVTAATVQFKEMGGAIKPVEPKAFEQPVEKKKGIADWMNMIKPGNEEKDHWVPDEAVTKCTGCGTDFSAFNRKHHCRNCGDIFCDKCTHGRIALTAEQSALPVRVCDRCLAEVTQRLTNAKEASKPSVLASHEDLAKKLQDEMEKNRKSSSGFKSDAYGRRMKEVECPTCTVHLQVQVPVSGSETIECGVCQRPFLVSAH